MPRLNLIQARRDSRWLQLRSVEEIRIKRDLYKFWYPGFVEFRKNLRQIADYYEFRRRYGSIEDGMSYEKVLESKRPKKPVIAISLVSESSEKLNIFPDLFSETLQGVFGDRIRSCTICRHIYWARRVTTVTCSVKCGYIERQNACRKMSPEENAQRLEQRRENRKYKQRQRVRKGGRYGAILSVEEYGGQTVVVNGYRYRESLGTTDGRKALGLEQSRMAERKDKAPDPTRRGKEIGSMAISDAVKRYILDRSAQVSPRMVNYWREQGIPLIRSKAFANLKLNKIRPTDIGLYQTERLSEGRAPKTVNGEVSVLRQLLKHARLWYRFVDDYKPIPNTKPPVGRALSSDETARLIAVAKTRPDWTYAYTATILNFYCGMRACEIKGLRWVDIDWNNAKVEIRRSKTPAGWGTPSLNKTCFDALRSLFNKASVFGYTEPDHYVFPWHGREQKIDPTKPITSWRSAWRSILKTAGLEGCDFMMAGTPSSQRSLKRGWQIGSFKRKSDTLIRK